MNFGKITDRKRILEDKLGIRKFKGRKMLDERATTPLVEMIVNEPLVSSTCPNCE